MTASARLPGWEDSGGDVVDLARGHGRGHDDESHRSPSGFIGWSAACINVSVRNNAGLVSIHITRYPRYLAIHSHR